MRDTTELANTAAPGSPDVRSASTQAPSMKNALSRLTRNTSR